MRLRRTQAGPAAVVVLPIPLRAQLVSPAQTYHLYMRQLLTRLRWRDHFQFHLDVQQQRLPGRRRK